MKYATCHPERKHHAKNLCASCYNVQLLMRSPDAYERHKARVKRWQVANAEDHRETQKYYQHFKRKKVDRQAALS